CLSQIGGALAQLVEQPDILDGNHSLVGEVLDKLDLPVTERAHLLAVNDNDAKHCIFLEQRDCEHGSQAIFHSTGPYLFIQERVFSDIGSMNYLFGPDCSCC